MTLKEFIEKYDFENSIVLLEGKRSVLGEDKEKISELGKLRATKTKNILFRSGNADGADYFFSLGVASIDNSRLHVITPYSGHRKKNKPSKIETISLDNINIAEELEVIYQSKQNKKMEKLIDLYVSGDRRYPAIKAAYILRDTVKVIGTGDIKPTTFGIFYDDLKKPKDSGTGHTMKVCEKNRIPIINQTTWVKWLEE